MKNLLRRGGWKPWNWSSRKWCFAIVVGILVSPPISRWMCLWQIPDVALPDDVEDVIRDEVPPDEDAFIKYEEVVKKLRQHQLVSSATTFDFSVGNLEGDWDPKFSQWLIDRRGILADYQSAGAMPRAGGPSVRTATLSLSLALHQELRALARFSEAQAALYEYDGDLERAWTCHLATLRSGIHAEKPGFAICSLVGVVVRNLALEGIVKWARDPKLTPQQLRAARVELAQEFARRMPPSQTAKAEYLSMKNSLDDPEAPNWIVPKWPVQGPLLKFKRVALWCVGEPELTLRLERQMLVNNGTEIGKPKYQRRQNEDSYRLIFELDPQSPRQRGQLTSRQLAHAAKSTFPFFQYREIGWADRQFDRALQRGNARAASIMILLAAEEFQRIYGEFPVTLEQLVPAFLDEIPFDPFDDKGAPIRYRRDNEAEAIVWSIAENGIDDGGDLDFKSLPDIGYRIRVKQRADNATEDNQ